MPCAPVFVVGVIGLLLVFDGNCRDFRDFRAVAAGAGRATVRLRAESSDVASAESVTETEMTVWMVTTMEVTVGV